MTENHSDPTTENMVKLAQNITFFRSRMEMKDLNDIDGDEDDSEGYFFETTMENAEELGAVPANRDDFHSHGDYSDEELDTQDDDGDEEIPD